jgi:hypothetical protein
MKIVLMAFVLILTNASLSLGAEVKKTTTPTRETASAAGRCVEIDIEDVQGYDHSCQGTWLATRKDSKILFCCQQSKP